MLPPLVTSPSHWLLGPSYHARRNAMHWMAVWAKEYGDIFRLKSPLGQATVVTSPEFARQVLVDHYPHYQQKSQPYAVLRILMGNGLVTSEGEFWRGQRKLVQPAFHRKRLDGLFAMMVERVTDMAGRIKRGTAVDFAPVLSQLTLDIIARAMFSSDVQGAAADVAHHIATLNEYALRMLRNPLLFLLPRNIPLPFVNKQQNSLKALNRIVHGIIQTRRRDPHAHDDLLSMLLSACEEGSGRRMTDEQLRDEVMTIFVAGHETTANAMAWLMYLVSQHPAVEERLRAEITTQPPDSFGSLTYTRQVIDESLRLYPTIWSVGRRCTEDDELGGYTIPKGMNVVVPIFHYHWDERFWVEPRKFDPERFGPERRPAPDAMTYFPFGAGPRSCIGNHFAMQELMIMTAVFYRRFTFRVEPGFIVEPDALITLRPKHGMRLVPEALNESPKQNPVPGVAR